MKRRKIKIFLLISTIIMLFIGVTACRANADYSDLTPRFGRDRISRIQVINEIIQEEVLRQEILENEGFENFYQFLAVEIGLSSSDIIAILGYPVSVSNTTIGRDVASSKTWLVPDEYSGPTTVSITFQNDIATSIIEKSYNRSSVSHSEYLLIENGMTEYEVFEILGLPYTNLFMKANGNSFTTASWINKDYSSLTITFMNGKVMTNFHSNLYAY